MAAGESIAKWARENQVPRRTAYFWAKQPEVRVEAEANRLRIIDRAVGLMTRRATWAADELVQLAKNAESESVKLSALRAILNDMMLVSTFAGLEQRITQVEEQIRQRSGHRNRRR
jgi:hypothetical protein